MLMRTPSMLFSARRLMPVASGWFTSGWKGYPAAEAAWKNASCDGGQVSRG